MCVWTRRSVPGAGSVPGAERRSDTYTEPPATWGAVAPWNSFAIHNLGGGLGRDPQETRGVLILQLKLCLGYTFGRWNSFAIHNLGGLGAAGGPAPLKIEGSGGSSTNIPVQV